MALALKGLPAWSSIAGRRTAGDFVQGSRGIHIQAHPPPSSTPPVSHINVSGRVFRTAKSTFSRFITHLTTPGFSHSTAHSSKSLYTSAHIATRSKVNPIQNLPFPTRHALANGLGKTLYVPRIPTAVSRQSTFQVGLGTARNFSTSRGAFQHFVDNVPIALRAAYEADVDPKTATMRKEKMKTKKSKNRQNDKENALFEVLGDSVRSNNNKKASSLEKNLDTYFPISDATSDSDVSTYVLIPLAPTPTARLPLSSLSTDISSKHGPRLLPRSILMKVHRDHQMHSAKISSLFMRLDRANVWSKGVHCDVYGDPSGLCTILRLEFAGWTKEMVLGVLGEAGKGWCEVVEVKHSEENAIVSESELESVLSILGDDDASIFSAEDEDRVSAINQTESFDPSASFIMPTLSFSSSVADSIYGDLSRPGWSRELEAPAATPTELHSHHRNTGDFENISDAGSDESWASWNTLDAADSHHDVSVIPPPNSATASWLGVSFSSDFVRRQDTGIDSRAGERFTNVFY